MTNEIFCDNRRLPVAFRNFVISFVASIMFFIKCTSLLVFSNFLSINEFNDCLIDKNSNMIPTIKIINDTFFCSQ